MCTKIDIMPIHLVADDREKFVYPHLEKQFVTKKDQLKKTRLSRGDFALFTSITTNQDSKDTIAAESPIPSCSLLVTFERKTLKDYAAGIKDGRYENVAELIKLRNDTGCLIVFIIEHKVSYPALTGKHSGIPFKNILASIDLLTFRSGIHVIWTKNPEHTAERLDDFLQRYTKIEIDNAKGRVSISLRHLEPVGKDPTTSASGNGPHDAQDKVSTHSSLQPAEKGPDEKQSAKNESSTPSLIQEIKLEKPPVGGTIPEQITIPVDKDDDRLIKEMWHSVGEGISYAVSVIISSKFTVLELINKITLSELKALTHAGGSKFSKKIVGTLTRIKDKDKELIQKLIAGIHRLGKVSAQKIIDNVPVDDLLNLTPEKIQTIKIDGKRATAKLESIKKYFNYKSPAAK